MESISHTAKTKNVVFQRMPLQTHWFAMSLYDVYLKFQKASASPSPSPSPWSVDFEGQQLTLDLQSLTKASAHIKMACRTSKDEENVPFSIRSTRSLRISELCFSAIFSAGLNMLLCSCPNVTIIHQGPVRTRPKNPGNPEAADILGIRVTESDFAESIFVSDLKMFDMHTADNETALYAKYAAINQSVLSDDRCMIVLGLSGTPLSATLWAYLIGNKKIWAVPIITEVLAFNPSFLATLSIGIQFLAETPIFYNALECALPFRDISVTPLKANENNRTYLKTEDGHKTVVKFFDTHESALLSNVDVMKIAGVVVKEKFLTMDNRLSYIEYKYYDGGHEPVSLSQFRNILCMLHKLHKKEYVHGDIRQNNLVFDKDGRDGYLIDYDLARFCGKGKRPLYPKGYNYCDSIRHPDAMAFRPMQPSHDRHSLAIIVEKYYPDSKAVISKIRSSEPLKDIADLC